MRPFCSTVVQENKSVAPHHRLPPLHLHRLLLSSSSFFLLATDVSSSPPSVPSPTGTPISFSSQLDALRVARRQHTSLCRARCTMLKHKTENQPTGRTVHLAPDYRTQRERRKHTRGTHACARAHESGPRTGLAHVRETTVAAATTTTTTTAAGLLLPERPLGCSITLLSHPLFQSSPRCLSARDRPVFSFCLSRRSRL